MDTEMLNKLNNLAEASASSCGLKIFDVETHLSGKLQMVKITIDREEGSVGIDDCEHVSRDLSARLDAEDFIRHAFNLEVSSPGLERPLRSREDYLRFKGKAARLVLGDGGLDAGTVLEGHLAGMGKDTVLLDVDGKEYRVELARIKHANLVYENLERKRRNDVE